VEWTVTFALSPRISLIKCTICTTSFVGRIIQSVPLTSCNRHSLLGTGFFPHIPQGCPKMKDGFQAFSLTDKTRTFH